MSQRSPPCPCFPLQHVANMMLRMKREFAGSQTQILPVFDTLLLLDRNVDLLTPLATQLTYEGLIDEIYGITNGTHTPMEGKRGHMNTPLCLHLSL